MKISDTRDHIRDMDQNEQGKNILGYRVKLGVKWDLVTI